MYTSHIVFDQLKRVYLLLLELLDIRNIQNIHFICIYKHVANVVNNQDCNSHLSFIYYLNIEYSDSRLIGNLVNGIGNGYGTILL